MSRQTRLARRLGLGDAVVVGLGAMLGAGVFVAFAPAARAAGNALVLSLVLAAAVAACNAVASARLAARDPRSGGTYVYGRERLGPMWGYLAGWGFVAGKLASCAAMALTFGVYVAPDAARPLALAAVVAVTIVDALGVTKTALATRVIVVLVVGALASAIVAVWAGGAADAARLWPLEAPSALGVAEGAGFLFFAFAGYARIATLAEEVVAPERTLPRAILVALGLTLVIYVGVGVTLVAGLGAERLAAAPAPLEAAVSAGGFAGLAPIVRAGAALASLGVLLSLVAGVGRTVFAMAAEGDLPRALAAVHARAKVPRRAVIAVGGVVAVVVALGDVRQAIGFSAFTVLVYYAITNAAAWTLPGSGRGARVLAVAGLAGSLAVALTLPLTSVVAGAGVLALGLALHVARRRGSKRGARSLL